MKRSHRDWGLSYERKESMFWEKRSWFHESSVPFDPIMSSVLLFVEVLVLFGVSNGCEYCLDQIWMICWQDSLKAAPPKIRPFEFDRGFKAGSKASATCDVTDGSSPFKFEWLKNHKPIIEDDVVKIYNNEDISTIKFKSLRASDSGEYKCIVRNNEGSESFSAVLTVSGKNPIMSSWNVAINLLTLFSWTSLHS